MKKILPSQESNQSPNAHQSSTITTELLTHRYAQIGKLSVKVKSLKNHVADLGQVLVLVFFFPLVLREKLSRFEISEFNEPDYNSLEMFQTSSRIFRS